MSKKANKRYKKITPQSIARDALIRSYFPNQPQCEYCPNRDRDELLQQISKGKWICTTCYSRWQNGTLNEYLALTKYKMDKTNKNS